MARWGPRFSAAMPDAARGARHVAWILESTLASERERELRLSVRLLHGEDRSLRWVETAIAQAAGQGHRLVDGPAGEVRAGGAR